MDPDELLRKLRDLLGDWRATQADEVAEEIVEKITDLDEWLMKGGYLPRVWEEAAKRTMGRKRREEIIEKYPQAAAVPPPG